MGKWVISLSGERGEGPWLSNKQGGVYPTTNMREAGRSPSESLAGIWRTSAVHQGYPSAKVFRLVRRERHTAEERAVVEAALSYDALRLQFEQHYLTRTDGGPTAGDLSDADNCTRAACAALRAKRGGK